MNSSDIAIMVVLVSLTLLVLVAVLFVLLIGSSNRRHRHRAELAELLLHRDQELRRVEREATGHTLTDIGRELHDSVGQLLTVAQVGLLDHLDNGVQQHPRIHAALDALDEGLEEVRRLGRTLNQDNWQTRDLLEAVELEATRLERLGKARVPLTILNRPLDPSSDVKTILFRAFQEVIANALRHSRARTISITVEDQEGFSFLIQDDGCGFDTNAVGNGSGLNNIRHRCSLVNYTAHLQTSPGQGCTWHFKPDAHDPA